MNLTKDIIPGQKTPKLHQFCNKGCVIVPLAAVELEMPADEVLSQVAPCKHWLLSGLWVKCLIRRHKFHLQCLCSLLLKHHHRKRRRNPDKTEKKWRMPRFYHLPGSVLHFHLFCSSWLNSQFGSTIKIFSFHQNQNSFDFVILRGKHI